MEKVTAYWIDVWPSGIYVIFLLKPQFRADVQLRRLMTGGYEYSLFKKIEVKS